MIKVLEQYRFLSGTPRLLLVLWLLLSLFSAVQADQTAFGYLNELRQQAGMTPLKSDRELARAAQNHADYLALHMRGDVSRMASAHDESPGRAGFTGRTPQERALAAGYPHDLVKENVAIGHATPAEAIDGLMAAIYHRLAFLDFTLDQVGIGTASKSDVFKLGRSDLQAVCYQRPPDAEPDPPADCAGVTVTSSYMEELCSSLPQQALHEPPWPEACPNGVRLRRDYMQAFCADPPAEALHSGFGEYYMLCNRRVRVTATWMRNFCANPPPDAEYRASGRHYTMCEPQQKISAEWLEQRCRNAPEEALYTDSGVYYEICSNPFRLRANYLATLDRRQQLLQPDILVWPPDGATGISPVFYEESPDPLPDLSVSGYPLSVQVNPAVEGPVALESFGLYRQAGGKLYPVSRTRLLDSNSDPNKRLTQRQFVLFPLERLDWNSSYHAEVVMRIGEERVTKRWDFSTRATPAPLIRIGELTERLSLPVNQDVVIYYPPTRDEPYTLEALVSYHGTGIELDFEGLDYNTARVRFNAGQCEAVEWRFADGKRVDIELKGC
ncbi:MAG: CAP domain-containing protein [Gammaproteobacteria bacterium]